MRQPEARRGRRREQRENDEDKDDGACERVYRPLRSPIDDQDPEIGEVFAGANKG